MNKTRILVRGTIASAVFVAMTCHPVAAQIICEDPVVLEAAVVQPHVNIDEPMGLPEKVPNEKDELNEATVATEAEEAAAPVAAEPIYTVLSDKVHQLENRLEDSSSVHHYSFTAVRGQDVLLATPERSKFNILWKVEYRVDGAAWRLKSHNNPSAFKGLEPGSVVQARVSAVGGASVERVSYKLVMGSYPLRDYDLHDQEGFLKIPYGFTDPPFLATQAVDKALLETRFRDTKGAPLEGGVLHLQLRHYGPEDLGNIRLISGPDGKASRLLEFGKCKGGHLAQSFRYKQQNGVNTWATRYEVGKYSGVNVLLEDLADTPHVYNLGHICNRFLINWSKY
jgi:hypothetical protein